MSKPPNFVSKTLKVIALIFLILAIGCGIGAIVTTVWLLMYAGQQVGNGNVLDAWMLLVSIMFAIAFVGFGSIGLALGFVSKVMRTKATPERGSA